MPTQRSNISLDTILDTRSISTENRADIRFGEFETFRASLKHDYNDVRFSKLAYVVFKALKHKWESKDDLFARADKMLEEFQYADNNGLFKHTGSKPNYLSLAGMVYIQHMEMDQTYEQSVALAKKVETFMDNFHSYLMKNSTGKDPLGFVFLCYEVYDALSNELPEGRSIEDIKPKAYLKRDLGFDSSRLDSTTKHYSVDSIHRFITPIFTFPILYRFKTVSSLIGSYVKNDRNASIKSVKFDLQHRA